MRARLLQQLGLKRDDLSGKVAVVTGAGHGIGKELAIALSILGASVVIAELNDTGAETEAQIRAAGGKALFVKADISDKNNVRQLFEQSVRAYGKIDILVNNAVTIATGSVLELPVSAWDRVLAVNLKAPANAGSPPAALAAAPADIVKLSKDLQDVLAAVNKETEELDLFKKTWVKNDFNRKAGMSIKDWHTMSSDLTRDLKQLVDAGGNGGTGMIKGKFPYYISRLEKLAAYFNAQAANAKGYFKDPQQREVAMATLAQREKAASAMAKALNDLNE